MAIGEGQKGSNNTFWMITERGGESDGGVLGGERGTAVQVEKRAIRNSR